MKNKNDFVPSRFRSGETVYLINSRFFSRLQPFSFVGKDRAGVCHLRYVKKDGSLGCSVTSSERNLCIGWAF